MSMIAMSCRCTSSPIIRDSRPPCFVECHHRVTNIVGVPRFGPRGA